MLESLSKKWQLIQLTHNVSAAATNSFWQFGLSLFPGLVAAKEMSGTNKNVPGFIHLRRELQQDMCPPIYMTFAYLNRITKNVEIIKCNKAPIRKFPKSQYIKLYEEAHIKVIHLMK